MAIPSDYKQISWSHLWHLSSMSSKQLKGPCESKAFRKQVYDWHQTALKLHKSATAYVNFSTWIRDLFSLRLVKKWILKVLLPKELSKIDHVIYHISSYLLHNKPSRDPIEIINKAHQYFQENKARFFSNRRRGLPLIGRITHPAQHSTTLEELENKVNSFFQEKLKLAKEGSTSLPRWYHATPDSIRFENILSSNLVEERKPRFTIFHSDTGAYVSSEQELDFGEYAIAFSHQALSKYPGHYFNSGPAYWVQILSHVTVDPSDVSHLVVPSQYIKESLTQKIKQIQGAVVYNPMAKLATLPIIDRETNRVVAACFDQVHTDILHPNPCWKRHPRYNSFSKPSCNIQECTYLFFQEQTA